MEDNITHVLHGFFSLTAKEKLRLVEAINEYFDATEREPIRAAHEAEFARLRDAGDAKICPCCGR